jgi:hypothetical protein
MISSSLAVCFILFCEPNDNRRSQWIQNSSSTSVSLVSTTEEQHGRHSSGWGLEIREYGRRDPSCTLYPQKLTVASPTIGGRSVGIIRSRTQVTEFSFNMEETVWKEMLTWNVLSSYSALKQRLLCSGCFLLACLLTIQWINCTCRSHVCASFVLWVTALASVRRFL